MTLETERLILRRWTHADVERHLEIYSLEPVTRWIGREPLTSPDEAAASIDRYNRFEPDWLGVWAVVPREGGVIAGSVLLIPIPPSGQERGLPPDQGGEVEVGWHLHPDFWGRGYASEAGRAALEHGFAQGLEEILAVTNLDNHPSQAVCRRIGMEHLGRTDRYYGHELELFAARRPRR